MHKPAKTTIMSAICLTLIWGGTAGGENRVGDQVVLRTLDKVTATTKDYVVNIGDILQYGSLIIDVKHCEKKPPEDIPETFAFLQIYDKRTDGKGLEIEPEKLFSGWMFASKPAISALDHPVYDVWLIDCKDQQSQYPKSQYPKSQYPKSQYPN